MNVKKKLLVASLAVVAPIAFAQQPSEMPASPIVSTADMMAQAQSSGTKKVNDYGQPVSDDTLADYGIGSQSPSNADMPVVSATAIQNGVPSGKPLAEGQKVHDVKKIADNSPPPNYKTTPVEVVTEFGKTELVNVAIGHPTRIVTPFMKPSVLKIDEDAIVSVKQNVVYFASDKRTPVTLHIREEGYEAKSVSLTLLPQKIPPREVIIKISDADMMDVRAFGSRNEVAEKWEQSEPYEKTLINVMTTLAKGEIPQGFRMRDFSQSDYAPTCQQRGLKFTFEKGQVVTGSNLTVYVGVAKNISSQSLEFVETNCASREVASVATWPDVYLAPGQATEVFVVDKAQPRTNNTKRRQSLIGGGQ